MSQGAGQPGWRRLLQAYLAKLDGPDIRVGQMLLLWASAVTVVILVCAAFFSTMYWLFS